MEHALTIDLEDWYDTEAVRAHTRRLHRVSRLDVTVPLLLKMLERHGARAGHEVASHGFSHRPVGELPPGCWPRPGRCRGT